MPSATTPERFLVTSGDGTRLMAYKLGNGPARWLLPPGLGTPVESWRHLTERFGERLTILTWDLRGTYASQVPADRRRMGIAHHAEDGEAVAAAVGWLDGAGFLTGGWSLGIEIGLELYRRRAGEVRALVLINGSFEHILRSALNLPHAEVVFSRLTRALLALPPVVTPAGRFVFSRPWFDRVLVACGLRASAGDRDLFAEILQRFAKLDFVTYLELILAANVHSARDVLPRITVPTLITAGTDDRLTPLAKAHEMHALIPGSELFVVPGGTHYTLLEFPELINERLDAFLRGLGI